MQASDKIVWKPDAELMENCNLTHYRKWLVEKGYLSTTDNDYEKLWQWSVNDLRLFWKSIAEYFGLTVEMDREKVLSSDEMPGAKWFSSLKVNYAAQVFANANSEFPALMAMSETRELESISWEALAFQIKKFRAHLLLSGVQKGDRVVAYISNIPEATAAFLACASLGAVWSSCSPDFGVGSVLERFSQIKPKVLLATDGYAYNGKNHCRLEKIGSIVAALDSLESVVLVPFYNGEKRPNSIEGVVWWTDLHEDEGELEFVDLPFDHPIWILYSSGTTGAPKAITHSHGGVLLEHLKYLHLQNDVRKGERFFWFSTTGWMMWNFVNASLLVGATAVLYDGSPGYPNLKVMWKFIQDAGIHHFGTSAPFLVACMKNKLHPAEDFDLSHLRSIGSTGSPLPPEAFDWVYKKVKKEVWLCSMSGGTDVCTAFVGSSPWKPVRLGEIQCRALGCDMHALDDDGKKLLAEVGEMVVMQPMPSMPVFFWNDEDGSRYRSSYFEHYPGKWRHGDWVEINDRGGLIIHGRSDATLNRQGVRIGTAEIYRAVDKINSIKDSLIVNLELSGGNHYMPLFVVMNEGQKLSDEVIAEIKSTLRATYSPRHVPDEVIEIAELPYTISGKKMEAPVKKILIGKPIGKAANTGAMKNPESLEFFVKFAKERSFG
ncbi:MAG: acetoacetate--CoA ligase [Saprospirales bacterium]|nr:MAG: acetoacetate--CoA ligase [Saprospirales bacterium]